VPAEAGVVEVLLPWCLAGAVAWVVHLSGGLPEWSWLERAQRGTASTHIDRLVEAAEEGPQMALLVGNSRLPAGLRDPQLVEQALEDRRGGDWQVQVLWWPDLGAGELLPYLRELRAARPAILVMQWDTAFPAHCSGDDDHEQFAAIIRHHEDFRRAGVHATAAVELLAEARGWGGEAWVVEMPDREGLRAGLSADARADRERSLLHLEGVGAQLIRSSDPWKADQFEDFVHLGDEGAERFAGWLADGLTAPSP
jgi:hypothetical protein